MASPPTSQPKKSRRIRIANGVFHGVRANLHILGHLVDRIGCHYRRIIPQNIKKSSRCFSAAFQLLPLERGAAAPLAMIQTKDIDHGVNRAGAPQLVLEIVGER